MDAKRFDALTKALPLSNSRRGLVRLLAALPVAGVLTALLREGGAAGRRHRRTLRRPADRRQQVDAARKKQPKKCAKAGQTTSKKRKGCCVGLSKDESGRCAAPPSPEPPSGCTGLKPTNTSPTQGLQEAINVAADGATLTLCAGTWNLTNTVVITRTLTLVGAGAGQTILDGGRPPSGLGGVRVLRIDPGAHVTLQDLMITKGQAAGFRFPDFAGGGIYNDQGTLALVGVSVTDNTAELLGGGIFNDGTLTLRATSSVSGNTSRADGGGIHNNSGSMTMDPDSGVTNNEATNRGGGIYTNVGRVTLRARSRVRDNKAPSGAAIFIDENGGIVLLDDDAVICDNTPLASQCTGSFGGNGDCPSTVDGVCVD